MHSYVGNTWYKHKTNCCICSDPFRILLLQLCWGIKTIADYTSVDWSKCWDMLRVCSYELCFSFHTKCLPPIEGPCYSGCGKIQQILPPLRPVPGTSALQHSHTALWPPSSLPGLGPVLAAATCTVCYSATPSGVLRQETNWRKVICCFHNET